MPRGRALRQLNVNPGTMQKSVDLKTVNAAFACTENVTGNKRMLERSSKNAQLLKENKLVKQLEQEALTLEQQAASTSTLDPPIDSPENSESANISEIEDPNNDYFPPTGLICASSDRHGSSRTTATVENSGSLTSNSNNIVADLHEKLCSSHAENKERVNRKRSQSSDTDDSLPLLNTIVNEILSLEADFPLPSTSSADTVNNTSAAEWRKRYKRTYSRAASKRSIKQRKVNEDLAFTLSVPIALVENTASRNIPVISDSDSDCEITGYYPSNVPSYSHQINVFSEMHSNNGPELHDQSVLELYNNSVPPVLGQNSEDANCTNERLDSIINMLNDTVQSIDDDVLVIDTRPQRGHEQTLIESGTNLNRSVIEVATVNVRNQPTPPIIVVSDDESEPSVEPILSKELKPTARELSSQQDVASSKGRTWQCPVCWEELTSERGVYSTMCGHVFCNPCITHVLKTIKKCPMCRNSLNKKKVHPLFLDDQ